MGYSIWDQVCLIQLEKTSCCYLPIISSRAPNKNILSPSPSQPYLLRGERSASVWVLTPGQQHLFVIQGIRTVPFLGSFWEESACCLVKSRISHWARLLAAYWWYIPVKAFQVIGCISVPAHSSRLQQENKSWCVTRGAVVGMTEVLLPLTTWEPRIFVLERELMNGRNLGWKSHWQARAGVWWQVLQNAWYQEKDVSKRCFLWTRFGMLEFYLSSRRLHI